VMPFGGCVPANDILLRRVKGTEAISSQQESKHEKEMAKMISTLDSSQGTGDLAGEAG
jgi:hypothetical protein